MYSGGLGAARTSVGAWSDPKQFFGGSREVLGGSGGVPGASLLHSCAPWDVLGGFWGLLGRVIGGAMELWRVLVGP